ncbi:MAG: hypothetical protein NT166_32630 [Candidatus Aminicenantes bacterium]|nr:hypothetical protein [Candidatus Aminicenantes bacterium]
MLKSRFIRLGAWILSLIFFFSVGAFSQEEILKNMESGNIMLRQDARKALTDYLEKLDESNRSAAATKLIDTLVNPATGYQLKLGICYGLGDLRKVSWKVANQQDAETRIYDLFRSEKTHTLKVQLDEALMTAAGLYWDAINDYNNDLVDQVEATAGKFRRVFENYHESSYAAKAHFYLASYYTRVYFILKNRDKNTSVDLWIKERANPVLQDFISKMEKGAYKPGRLQEARYFLALNNVLLNKFKDARDCLDEIMKDRRSETQIIYVHQYYYSPRKEDIIDKSFAPMGLAKDTYEYLYSHPNYDDSYLDKFVKYLKEIN